MFFVLDDGVGCCNAEECFRVVSSVGGASFLLGRVGEGVETDSF